MGYSGLKFPLKLILWSLLLSLILPHSSWENFADFEQIERCVIKTFEKKKRKKRLYHDSDQFQIWKDDFEEVLVQKLKELGFEFDKSGWSVKTKKVVEEIEQIQEQLPTKPALLRDVRCELE